MSKSKFIGLIFMMLLSITGIVYVQVVWIRNALGILNENFDRAVIASLNDAANTIESNRKMSFYNDIMFDDSLMPEDSDGDISSYLSVGSYSSNDGKNFSYSITHQSITGTIDSLGNVRLNKPVVTHNDTAFYADSGSYIIPSRHGPPELKIANNNSIIKRGRKPAGSGNQDYMEWLKKRNIDTHNMNNPMVSEIYQWEKIMALDKNEVAFALRNSFMFSRIETPFEFGIIKNGELEEGAFKKSDKDDLMKSNYMVRLFPDNIIGQNLILSVIFPERTNYVLGSMIWPLGGSLLLSLIVIATFAFSLYFIIRQKKISEMKSDFLNNMTHEFKTPIATISLAADTITNPKVIRDENSIKHFISLIKKENSRMNKKVETILQIASLDKKEIEFKFENLSLHTLIERVVETIEIQVHQRNGNIQLKLDAEEPVIYGDYEHLTNLVNNLLDNAIKYSPGAPDITVETKNNEKGILLSVTDKGIGMSKSVQSKIFERFYRQASGNIHNVKGFGLGLNYVRAIIDAHKGSVIVYSEPGKGSRFEIFLPFNWDN
jgi:two-component system phosphate regulon sensor histidine kinase PhoR